MIRNDAFVVHIIVVGRFCAVDTPTVAWTTLAVSEVTARTTVSRETYDCAGANALGPILAKAAFGSWPLPLAPGERQ